MIFATGSPPMSHHELDKHNDIPLNFISGRNLDMHLSPHESEIPSFVSTDTCHSLFMLF